jgi:hypothetical protein
MLSVYPNPNNGKFSLETAENAHIVAMNAVGQIVQEQTATSIRTEISLKEKDNGIYFIQVITNGHQQLLKIIKQ